MRLGAVEEAGPIKAEFKSILSMVESALSNMESYGNDTDKAKAKNFCNMIRSCQSKLG
jgi:hypothetical protein